MKCALATLPYNFHNFIMDILLLGYYTNLQVSKKIKHAVG